MVSKTIVSEIIACNSLNEVIQDRVDVVDKQFVMRNYQWNDHLIEVEIRPFGPYLWLLLAIEVRVDQRRFLPEPDHIGLTTYTNFEIKLKDGSRTTGVVKTLAPIWFRRAKCAIIVNDTIIAREILPIRRWYLPYVVVFIVTILLFLTLLGLANVLIIIRMIFNR